MLFSLPFEPPSPANGAFSLAQFHAGDRRVLEGVYREHFRTAFAAAARILCGVDAETVIHEVFFRLLSDESMRRRFEGGNLGAWIVQVVRNAAIDHYRRRRREVQVHQEDDSVVDDEAGRLEETLESKRLVETFLREHLPAKLHGLFDARFMRQISQREAADELKIQRSTLAYQEEQIRALLTSFLLARKP